MPPNKFDDDERPTLTTCLACGGAWKWTYTKDGVEYHITCRFCTRGGMTRKQALLWQEHRKSRPDK